MNQKYDVIVKFQNGKGISSERYNNVEFNQTALGVDIFLGNHHTIAYYLPSLVSIEIRKPA